MEASCPGEHERRRSHGLLGPGSASADIAYVTLAEDTVVQIPKQTNDFSKARPRRTKTADGVRLERPAPFVPGPSGDPNKEFPASHPLYYQTSFALHDLLLESHTRSTCRPICEPTCKEGCARLFCRRVKGTTTYRRPVDLVLKRAKWKNGRGERIRTSDPLLPKQVRYQAALRPDWFCEMPIVLRSRKPQAV